MMRHRFISVLQNRSSTSYCHSVAVPAGCQMMFAPPFGQVVQTVRSEEGMTGRVPSWYTAPHWLHFPVTRGPYRGGRVQLLAKVPGSPE